MKKNKNKMSWDTRIFLLLTRSVMIAFALVCAIPFFHLLAVSLSAPGPVQRGEVLLIPKEFTVEVYKVILREGTLIVAMVKSICITAVYTLLSMVVTILCAYPLSEPHLMGRKFLTKFIVFTMYFSGGMIPTYLMVKSLGMIDSYLALIIPACLSTYNMIVLRSFFSSIPTGLKEAALIDGAGDTVVLTQIVLPNSKAALATVSLYYMVSKWNSFMDALLYINDPGKSVLQIRLRQLIQNAGAIDEILQEGDVAATALVDQTVKAGALMFSIVPVLIIYPFLQKHFTKGTMIGSLKG